jgi:hypothetical protein
MTDTLRSYAKQLAIELDAAISAQEARAVAVAAGKKDGNAYHFEPLFPMAFFGWLF